MATVTPPIRYGIGMVHYKQEQYELAGYYFEKALEINPASAPLLCYLAMVCMHVAVMMPTHFVVLNAYITNKSLLK